MELLGSQYHRRGTGFRSPGWGRVLLLILPVQHVVMLKWKREDFDARIGWHEIPVTQSNNDLRRGLEITLSKEEDERGKGDKVGQTIRSFDLCICQCPLHVPF